MYEFSMAICCQHAAYKKMIERGKRIYKFFFFIETYCSRVISFTLIESFPAVMLHKTHPLSSNVFLSSPHQAAGRTSCLVRTSDDAGTSMRPTKKAKKQVKERPQTTGNYSDGYSSETDVDDPDDEDMDTDEERAISLSPVKPNKESEKAFTVRQGQGNGEEKGQATSKSKPGNADDSQELFNASLEAELYLPDTRMGKQCTTSSVSPVKPASQPPPQLTRSKVAEPVTSPTLPISPTIPMSNNDYDDDTQRSILNDLF